MKGKDLTVTSGVFHHPRFPGFRGGLMGERETPDRSLRSYLSIPSCVSAVLISLPYRSLSLAHIHLTDTQEEKKKQEMGTREERMRLSAHPLQSSLHSSSLRSGLMLEEKDEWRD